MAPPATSSPHGSTSASARPQPTWPTLATRAPRSTPNGAARVFNTAPSVARVTHHVTPPSSYWGDQRILVFEPLVHALARAWGRAARAAVRRRDVELNTASVGVPEDQASWMGLDYVH